MITHFADHLLGHCGFELRFPGAAGRLCVPKSVSLHFNREWRAGESISKGAASEGRGVGERIGQASEHCVLSV